MAQEISREGRRIRRMFAGISPRYDLLNHVLSLNIDRSWRRRAARALGAGPGDRVLDLCTGTGDLAFELARRLERGRGQVVGTDFCAEMVALGEAKRRRRGEDRVSLVVADALELPFPSGSFDAASVAFGIRNVCDPPRALAEVARVLRPGGKLAVLEFSLPRSRWLARAYGLYFRQVLPRLGRWLSGSAAGGDAYAYLPESVSAFVAAEELAPALEAAGFIDLLHRRLTAGVVTLHVARRAGGPRRSAELSATGTEGAVPWTRL